MKSNFRSSKTLFFLKNISSNSINSFLLRKKPILFKIVTVLSREVFASSFCTLALIRFNWQIKIVSIYSIQWFHPCKHCGVIRSRILWICGVLLLEYYGWWRMKPVVIAWIKIMSLQKLKKGRQKIEGGEVWLSF